MERDSDDIERFERVLNENDATPDTRKHGKSSGKFKSKVSDEGKGEQSGDGGSESMELDDGMFARII